MPFEYLVLALLVAIAYFWRVGYIGGSGGMFAREPSNSSPAFSVPLPEFSAGDVHQYFRRVRRVQDANGWTDNDVLRLIPTKLSGKALAAYEELRAEDLSIESLQTQLEDSLRMYADGLTKFYRVRYLPGQSIEEFLQALRNALRMANLPDLATTTEEALLKEQFVAGMQSRIANRLREMPTDVPLSEITRLAKQLLRADGSGESWSESRRTEFSPSTKTLYRPTDHNRRWDHFQGNCFRCGKPGHRASQCWTQTRRQSGNGRGFFTPVGDKCLRSLSPGNAKLKEDALDGEDGAAAICGGVLSTPEVQSLCTRVTSQDREIQLKKITGILPISKSSKKQKQDYEATLEENDELHRKVERLEEEHRRQEQTLMQELSKIHDEKDALERERDRLLQGAGGEATSSEQQADNSELRHLQAENAVLQKTLAATRERMEQEMAAVQKKVKSAEDRDGAASPDLPDGTPSTGAFDAGRLAEVELRLETALEEKKMLQRDSEQNKNRLNAALTECRAEAEKWEKKAKQKQESLRQLQEEKDQMYRDHQSSISAMEASRNSELQSAMAQNAKIQAELMASSEELLAERSAVEELRTQLAEAQNQASSNSEEADRLVSSLRGEMASLEKDLGDKIKRQESAKTGEIEELSGNLKQAQERAQRFERERDQALEALDEANKVADKRKTLMDSMAIEKQQAATNIQEKLAEQSQGYENRLQASQERISQLQHQSAHQRISQLQEQVSRLSKLEEEM